MLACVQESKWPQEPLRRRKLCFRNPLMKLLQGKTTEQQQQQLVQKTWKTLTTPKKERKKDKKGKKTIKAIIVEFWVNERHPRTMKLCDSTDRWVDASATA